MSKEITIASIHTPCKDCSFAKYNENTQTGCEIDLISRYKNTGAEIVEAYDDHKEFYVINNRKCIGYRKNSWFDQFGTNLSLSEKIEKVSSGFKLKYILFIDLKNLNLEKLRQILNQVTTIDILPSKIILLRHNNSSEIFEFNDIQNLLKESGLNCPWRLQTMLDSDVSLRSILSNTICNNSEHKFIFYVSEHTNNLFDIITVGNDMVFKDLSSFIVLTNAEKSGKLFLGLIYRYAWFSAGLNLLEDANSFITIP